MEGAEGSAAARGAAEQAAVSGAISAAAGASCYPAAERRFAAGQWVRIQGLQANAELNGRDARVLEWCPDVGRWSVRVLGSGDCIRVRGQNLGPCVDEVEEREARDDGQHNEQGRQRQRRGGPGCGETIPQGRYTSRDLPRLSRQLASTSARQQRVAAAAVRMLLAGDRPPIEQVLAHGCVPRLVDLLRRPCDDCDLQMEAAWALTNVASGNKRHTRAVVDAGGIEVLIDVLKRHAEQIGGGSGVSRLDCVSEQAVWALANIAGDSTEHRDVILQHGAVQPLLRLLAHGRRQREPCALVRELSWCLSQLCRGEPGPSVKDVQPLLGPVSELLRYGDREVVMNACWALSYISGNVSVDAVHQLQVVPRLAEILEERKKGWLTPALNTIGNLAAGDTEQAGAVIAAGALRLLRELMQSKARCVRKEACWIVSNILAGTEEHIEAALDAELLSAAVRCARAHADEVDVRTEALWAVQNLVSGGSTRQVLRAVQAGVIPLLVSGLGEKGCELPKVAVDALQSIFDASITAGDPSTREVMLSSGVLAALQRVTRLVSVHPPGQGTRYAAKALHARLSAPWLSPESVGTPELADLESSEEEKPSAAAPAAVPSAAPAATAVPATSVTKVAPRGAEQPGRQVVLKLTAMLQRQKQRRKEHEAEEEKARRIECEKWEQQRRRIVLDVFSPDRLRREEERLRNRLAASEQEALERVVRRGHPLINGGEPLGGEHAEEVTVAARPQKKTLKRPGPWDWLVQYLGQPGAAQAQGLMEHCHAQGRCCSCGRPTAQLPDAPPELAAHAGAASEGQLNSGSDESPSSMHTAESSGPSGGAAALQDSLPHTVFYTDGGLNPFGDVILCRPAPGDGGDSEMHDGRCSARDDSSGPWLHMLVSPQEPGAPDYDAAIHLACRYSEVCAEQLRRRGAA